jgi:hypothetical protein
MSRGKAEEGGGKKNDKNYPRGRMKNGGGATT